MRKYPMPALSSRSFLVPVIALALAGCGSSDYLGKTKEPDPNILPTNYKNEIILNLKTTLIDPTNVKDAYITEPFLAQGVQNPRYVVCIRSNSRGYQREYLGSKDRIAYFYAGQLNQLIDAKPEQCAKADYKPFPELQKLCLGASCE
jgi:hypothetical protein